MVDQPLKIAASSIAALQRQLRGDCRKKSFLALKEMATIASEDDQIQAKIASDDVISRSVAIATRAIPPENAEAAVTALGAFSRDCRANQIKIAQAGGSALIVSFVADGSPDMQRIAMTALASLAKGAPTIQTECAQVGAIPLLLQRFRQGCGEHKIAATEALCQVIAGHTDNEAILFNCGGARDLVRIGVMGAETHRSFAAAALRNGASAVPELLALIQKDESPAIKDFVVIALRDLMDVGREAKERFFNSGGIQVILEDFCTRTTKFKEVALVLLAKWVKGVRSHQYTIMDVHVEGTGFNLFLCELVERGSGAQKELAAMLLATILENNPETQTRFYHCAAAEALGSLLRHGSRKQSEAALEAFRWLIQNHEKNQFDAIDVGIVPLVLKILRSGGDRQKLLATDLLSTFDGRMKDKIREEDMIPLLALLSDLARRGSETQQKSAARALGVFAHGNGGNRSKVFDAGGLHALINLKNTGCSSVNSAASWATLHTKTRFGDLPPRSGCRKPEPPELSPLMYLV